MLVSGSQTDWFAAEDYTYEQFKAMMWNHHVRNRLAECAPGSPVRDTDVCHSVKEADPRLIGKAWASLKHVNLTALNVETFGELLEVQVRTRMLYSTFRGVS